MTGRLQLKDGMWYTVINYKDSDGSYKQKWQNTGLKERGNKKEAIRILEERVQEFEIEENQKKEKYKRRIKAEHIPLGTAETRFVDYCKAYLETVKNRLTPYVYTLYSKYYIRTYEKYFKNKKVIDITSDEIDSFNDHMRKERGVKDSTLKHYAEILRPALYHAFKIDKIIPDNPYEDIKPLKVIKTVMGFYNRDELEKLFEIIKGHKLELAILIAAHYGFRRSELLGLRWKAIDFDHNTISIHHKVLMIDGKYILDDSLKSRASYRTLPLLPHLIDLIMEHKNKIDENKKYFGSTYNNEFEEYIFVDEKGTLFQPTFVSHNFNKLLKEKNLKHIRFHDLRHSCASLLLANGISMKQIQEWLGHADFATTADRYTHLDYNSKVQSANAISSAFSKKFDNKTTWESENNQKDLEDFSKKISEEMDRLGFTSISEYINFLNESRCSIENDKNMLNKKSEIIM